MVRVDLHIRRAIEALGQREWSLGEDYREGLQRLKARIAPSAWREIRSAISSKYKSAEARYGRPMALAILSAAIVGTAVPVPGATLVAVAPLIGLAELHIRMTSAKDQETGLGPRVKLAQAEIRRIAQRWIEDLTELVDQLRATVEGKGQD